MIGSLIQLAISIHAAREGGDAILVFFCSAGLSISIHAAREGGDIPDSISKSRKAKFQSTPPVKAATKTSKVRNFVIWISIHAAREGGDPCRSRYPTNAQNFNPRRP